VIGPRDIKAVLATVPYEGWRLERLKEAFGDATFIHADPADSQLIGKALESVDVAVLKGDLDDRYLNAPHLRWIHCDHSGLNGAARPEVFERGLIVTGSAGRAAPALAHHVMFFVLSLVYDWAALYEAQQSHVWRGIPSYKNLRGVYGKTMGIVGLGQTGMELASLAKAFGMNVLAYKKTVSDAPDTVARLFCADAGDSLDELLAQSDFVVLTVRLTDDTYHLIGERELGLMKPSARLINMARGAVVDESALISALRNEGIAGAGLDVFEQEPLPPEDPIWDAPNVILTPHTTAEMPDLVARSLDIICENVRRYRNEEPMLNRLFASDVFSGGKRASNG
jgi:phosphoglycerate dehydrogenase-like enzyme